MLLLKLGTPFLKPCRYCLYIAKNCPNFARNSPVSPAFIFVHFKLCQRGLLQAVCMHQSSLKVFELIVAGFFIQQPVTTDTRVSVL